MSLWTRIRGLFSRTNNALSTREICSGCFEPINCIPSCKKQENGTEIRKTLNNQPELFWKSRL